MIQSEITSTPNDKFEDNLKDIPFRIPFKFSGNKNIYMRVIPNTDIYMDDIPILCVFSDYSPFLGILYVEDPYKKVQICTDTVTLTINNEQ